MTERMATPGLRRLPPYWHEYKTRAKTRWYGRQILEVFTTEFRDRTKEYYIWAIHHGLCTVNGHAVTPTYQIQNNDFLVNRVHRHEPAVTNAPVRILHRDDSQGRIVVVKPGSIPVHATGRYHHHTLVEMVKEQAKLQNLYTSNRLDRLTSGIMVCSTTKEAACELGNDFNAGLVNKAYVCRVAGRFPDGIVDCTEPILSVDRQSGLNIVHPKGKECRTLFQRLSYDAATDSSVLVCRPITGRTHQIRVHAQWLGHAISNDPLYNHPVWATVDRDVLSTAQPRHYERVGGESGNVEVERVLTALKGQRDDSEGWARWRDQVLFGALNRQLGYEDIYVPGPNGQPAYRPSFCQAHDNDGGSNTKDNKGTDGAEDVEAAAATTSDTCSVCHIPLLPDPAPGELFIYLHAIKYWTDSWVFEDELPWWACTTTWQNPDAPPQHERLPSLPLIEHHAGHDALGLGKGGAHRRVDALSPSAISPGISLGNIPYASRPQHNVSDREMPPVCVEVTRGLEDAVQRELLQCVPHTDTCCITTALHSGILKVDAPLHAHVLACYDADELPVAIALYFLMGHTTLPRDMLDALFAERVEALGKSGPQHEKNAPPTPSEHALLTWLEELWDAHAGDRMHALAAWKHHAARTSSQTWCVVVDRSSYVFPTLSTAALESHISKLVATWLDSESMPALPAPRSQADMLIKCTFAPRYGVDESLVSGPRARQGNPSGTCFFQLHVPGTLAVSSSDALRNRIARARAHALSALLPIGDGRCRISTCHSTTPSFVEALEHMLRVRGREACVVRGAPEQAYSMQSMLVEMPERARDMPHAFLFDHYMAELEHIAQGLEPGGHALVLADEPRTLQRAVRELENRARREQHAYVLRWSPVTWLDTTAWPSEDARTLADARVESQMRGGWRSYMYHRTFLGMLVQAPLYDISKATVSSGL